MPYPYKFYIAMHPADYFTLSSFIKHKPNHQERPLSRLLMCMKIAKSTQQNELIWYYQLYTKLIIFIYFTYLYVVSI
jgi:hypothetical protein